MKNREQNFLIYPIEKSLKPLEIQAKPGHRKPKVNKSRYLNSLKKFMKI